MHIEHVRCCHLVQHRSRRQSCRQGPRPLLQRDLQAIGQEGDEDVRLDAGIALMIDRPDRQIVDLAELQHMPLHRAATADTAVFHDAPIAVLLAVFVASLVPQKHAGRVPNRRRVAQDACSAPHARRARSPRQNPPYPRFSAPCPSAKFPRIGASCESRVKMGKGHNRQMHPEIYRDDSRCSVHQDDKRTTAKTMGAGVV